MHICYIWEMVTFGALDSKGYTLGKCQGQGGRHVVLLLSSFWSSQMCSGCGIKTPPETYCLPSTHQITLCSGMQTLVPNCGRRAMQTTSFLSLLTLLTPHI